MLKHSDLYQKAFILHIHTHTRTHSTSTHPLRTERTAASEACGAGGTRSHAATKRFAFVLEPHERKVFSDSRGSYKMTHKAVAPCLTVFFMGAQQSARLLTAVPLHFYSCH